MMPVSEPPNNPLYLRTLFPTENKEVTKGSKEELTYF